MNEIAPDMLRRRPSEETPATAGVEDEESQMRKALGLLGEPPRHRVEPERMDMPHRLTERLNLGGGLHRRRFVQDGDVPVTVLRRDAGHESPSARPSSAGNAPASSRLQRVEAALASEVAGREKAERLLQEAQAAVRDLQTKIGHAELACTETNEALRREREAVAHALRDATAWQERLQAAEESARSAAVALDKRLEELTEVKEQLQQEKRLRQAAERASPSREAAACVDVPGPAADLKTATGLSSASMRRLPDSAVVSPAIRRRRAAEPVVVEQEPVKWWLNQVVAPKRRRQQD